MSSFTSDYFTSNGKSWLEEKNPLDDSNLPFYVNNHNEKEKIIKILREPRDDGNTCDDNIFILCKPIGVGKTAFSRYLCGELKPINPEPSEIIVITVKKPYTIPTEEELQINTLCYLKNHGISEELLNFELIKEDNILDGNLSEIKTPLLDLQEFLQKK